MHELPFTFYESTLRRGESPQSPGARWLLSSVCAVASFCKRIKCAAVLPLDARLATAVSMEEPDDVIGTSIISLLLLLWRRVLRKNQGQ